MQRRSLLKGLMVSGVSATLQVTSPSLARALTAEVGNTSVVINSCLDASQRQMCAVLAELIIPSTDTPGAIEAGVPAFIEMMVSDWYMATERNLFIEGLAALNESCVSRYSKTFLEASQAQQIEALEYQETLALAYQAPVDPTAFLMPKEDEFAPFFDKLKELVVIGYYHSEVGATQELIYKPMPMEYADIPFVEVGRQWSS